MLIELLAGAAVGAMLCGGTQTRTRVVYREPPSPPEPPPPAREPSEGRGFERQYVWENDAWTQTTIKIAREKLLSGELILIYDRDRYAVIGLDELNGKRPRWGPTVKGAEFFYRFEERCRVRL